MQDHSNVNLVKDGSRRRSKRRRATSPPSELIGGVHRVADDSYADQDKGDKTMNPGLTTVAVSSIQLERKDKLGQRPMVFALLAVVVLADQMTKWWAWRHAPGAIINDGGNALVGARVSGWYADPVTGALLDLLDVGVLSAAVAVLMHRRRPLKVLVPGALMIGGWSSNLLDRLGMHYWTAPDSVRGAVDFIHLGHRFYNVADLFIIGATPVFLLFVGYLGARVTNRPAAIGSVARTTPRQPRKRAWMSALAGAVSVVVVVGIGAVNYGGVTAPDASATVSRHR
jgi:lipoprotein signal peptidase